MSNFLRQKIADELKPLSASGRTCRSRLKCKMNESNFSLGFDEFVTMQEDDTTDMAFKDGLMDAIDGYYDEIEEKQQDSELAEGMVTLQIVDEDQLRAYGGPPSSPLGNDESQGACGGAESVEETGMYRSYIESQQAKATVQKTKQQVQRFKEWMRTSHHEFRLPENIPPRQLDTYVSGFLLSLKKDDGSFYEPDTLTSYHRSIDRYLRSKGYEKSLIKSEEFQTSKSVLEARRKELKGQGKGNKPNKAEPLSKADEAKLWQSGAMGDHDPTALQNAIWFLLTKLCGFRGCHEARQLRWGDIQLKTDSEGNEMLVFSERLSKTRQGDTSGVRAFDPKVFADDDKQKCPIRLYKLYASVRPDAMKEDDSPFFLSINHQRKINSCWYKAQPMGVNVLQNIMKTMAKKAGIQGRITNHSVRKTTCSKLLHAGVAPILAAQLSGHKNVASLANYCVASEDQQREMCSILQDRAPTRALAPPLPTHPALPSPPTHPALQSPPAVRPSFALTPVTTPQAPSTLYPAALPPPPPATQLAGMFTGAHITGGTINLNFYTSSQVANRFGGNMPAPMVHQQVPMEQQPVPMVEDASADVSEME